MSNHETIHLIWRVTFLDLAPIVVTFDHNTRLNSVVDLPLDTKTLLTEFRSEKYIEAILVFEVVKNVSLDGIKVECEIGDLDNATAIVFVNTSGIQIMSNIL